MECGGRSATGRTTDQLVIPSLAGGHVGEDTRDFLLAEFGLLKDSKESQIRQEENRFNFFLIFLSALMATIALIVVDSPDYPPWLIAAAALAGSFIGAMMFIRMIHAHINATKYTRGLNRIRDYFLKNDPAFERIADQVLILPRSAEEPKLGEFGIGLGKPWVIGFPGLMNILNSILLGIAAEELLRLQGTCLPAALGGGMASVLAYCAQLVIYFRTIKRASRIMDSKVAPIPSQEKEPESGGA